MAPKFGTSGLRGLVAELTADLVADHIRAFLHACPTGKGLFVGRDLRPSSPALAQTVIDAARAEGVKVTDCGDLPTPALALAAMSKGAAAVMVTGSHIPADRNGLKFYVPGGEITKTDEVAIVSSLGRPVGRGLQGRLTRNTTAGPAWIMRYVTAFGPQALDGRRIGVWSHSAVSRDLIMSVVTALGAEVEEVGRSDTFIPVDTEAVPSWARKSIVGWVAEHRLDALISTDGDGDRPLLADDTGRVIPGDVLGQITARVIGAETVVTPITSNAGAELCKHFASVIRTKVGSPFVIAGMDQTGGRVVGYEANGGFLLGFDAALDGPLPRLMTRDSLLPLVAVLSAVTPGSTLSELVAGEPARAVSADRIPNFAQDRSARLLAAISEDTSCRDALVATMSETCAAVDMLDGVRIACGSGAVIHLRASGNAPELRVYVQADTEDRAGSVLQQVMRFVVERFE
jgi:phosphomannomutase